MINLMDINGNWHPYSEEHLAQQLVENDHKVYGVSLGTIGALRRLAMELGVEMPITEKSVQEVMRAKEAG